MSAIVHQRMTGLVAGANTVTMTALAEGEPNDLRIASVLLTVDRTIVPPDYFWETGETYRVTIERLG